MDILTLIIIFATVLILVFIQFMVAAAVLLIWYTRRKVNNIDITEYQLFKDSVRVNQCIARKVIDPRYGEMLVQPKLMPKSTKRILMYNFSDNNMHPTVTGRKHLSIVTKDGISAPLEYETKNIALTDEQKKVITQINEQYNTQITVNPETLSLTPIRVEQLRFKIDAAKREQEIYGDQAKQAAITLIKWAAIIFGITVIGVIVIIIIIITQNDKLPHAATVVAENVTNVVQTGIPGGFLPG